MAELTAAAPPPDAPAAGPSGLRVAWRRLIAQPLATVGLVMVALVIIGALGADWIAAHGPTTLNVQDRFSPPTAEYWMGTDQLGRDLFSRMLHGGRIALTVALLSVGVSLALGILLGLIAGYGPRWLDNALLLIFDTVRSFPTVMLALAAVTLFGPSLTVVIVFVIVTSIPAYARIVRTQTLSLRQSEFILAERAMGAGFFRVLRLHLLPNLIGPLLILASMDIPVVITIEAGLSFLGLGVRPPTPSWGSILDDGYKAIRTSYWLVIAGGLPVVITTLGFTFLGEALRDAFDPRLGRGR